jgi:hypothetical protein
MMQTHMICPITTAQGHLAYVKYDFSTLNIFVRFGLDEEWIFCASMGSSTDTIDKMMLNVTKTSDPNMMSGLRERINALSLENSKTSDDVVKQSNQETIEMLQRAFNRVALP